MLRPGPPAGLVAAAACILTGVVLAGAGLWLAPRAAGPGASPEAGRVGHGPSTNPQSVPTAAAASSTATLRVPAIGVRAAVEPVGRDGDGNMAAPSTPEGVGWYRYGPAPGDPGDAVIDGHLDWTNGPAVFWRLGQLRPGDAIYVDQPDGVTRMFQVDRLVAVPYDSHPPGLFETAGSPRLSLITCAGSYDLVHNTYSQRLIVDAALVAAASDETRVATQR